MINTVYNFNCNNNIFLNDVKKSYINYNSTLSKIKEKFTDYEFVKLNDVVMIDVSSPTVLVYCDCNLSEIDKCILSFIKNSILGIINSLEERFEFPNITPKSIIIQLLL